MSGNQVPNESGNWIKLALLVAVAGYLIYNMATATEAPSQTLKILQYVVLGLSLLGLAGLLMKLMAAKR